MKMTTLSDFYKKTKKDGPKVDKWTLLWTGKLNTLQRMSLLHGLDLHAAVPAWKTVWKHIEDRDGKMIKAYRDPNHKTKRADLPPIALQWKQAYSGGKING